MSISESDKLHDFKTLCCDNNIFAIPSGSLSITDGMRPLILICFKPHDTSAELSSAGVMNFDHSCVPGGTTRNKYSAPSIAKRYDFALLFIVERNSDGLMPPPTDPKQLAHADIKFRGLLTCSVRVYPSYNRENRE